MTGLLEKIFVKSNVLAITELKSEFINPDSKAPVMVVFGGNPEMLDHLVRLIEDFGKISVHATHSEEKGIQKLKSLPG